MKRNQSRDPLYTQNHPMLHTRSVIWKSRRPSKTVMRMYETSSVAVSLDLWIEFEDQ